MTTQNIPPTWKWLATGFISITLYLGAAWANDTNNRIRDVEKAQTSIREDVAVTRTVAENHTKQLDHIVDLLTHAQPAIRAPHAVDPRG